LVDFAFDFADGLTEPFQVRSEIRRAMEEIEKDKPQYLLEIGTAMGGTFFLLSRAANSHAKLISIDLPGGRWGGGYPFWKTLMFRCMLRPGQTARFIRRSSHDPRSKDFVEAALAGRQLDVLFIDGDHSYEGVKQDFLLYRDLVRPGGLVAFHDIIHHLPQALCAVDQFWCEVRMQYPSLEIIENPRQQWAGIGILRNEPVAGQRQ
jgi:predicted O-methyltransferase YrrM